MWPNGDMTESEACRASRRFVTGGARAGVAAPQGRGAGERSCHVGTNPGPGPRQLAVRAVRGPPPPSQAARAGGERPDRAGQVAVGTSLAVATRPIDRQAAEAGPAPAAAAGDQNANTGQDQNANAGQDQAAQPDQNAPAPPARDRNPGTDPNAAGTDGSAPDLENGEHPAYITKVSNSQIVVDVVQVFHDDAAVEAAIADGRSPADAKYLTTWVRNENSRLRTLYPGDLDIRLQDACGDPGDDRQALLTKLAANAKLKGTYYLLTVKDGKVERIEERLAINAC